MTPLRRAALAMVPLSEAHISEMYKVRDIKDYPRGSAITAVTAICESHERLRAEVEGAEIIIADCEAEIEMLKAALKSLCEYAAASRETNTPEFMEELGERMDAAAIAINEPSKFILHKRIETGELWFSTIDLSKFDKPKQPEQ